MARQKRPAKKRIVRRGPSSIPRAQSEKKRKSPDKALPVVIAIGLGALLIFGLIYAVSTKRPGQDQSEKTSATASSKAGSTKTVRNEIDRQGEDEQPSPRDYLARHQKKFDFELPVFMDGKLKTTIGPADFEKLTMNDFVTAWGGKAFGPLLIDVIKAAGITDGNKIKVTGSGKHAGVAELELAWEDVADKSNEISLSFTSRGTLKLVSGGKRFSTREMQVHDVSKVEVTP